MFLSVLIIGTVIAIGRLKHLPLSRLQNTITLVLFLLYPSISSEIFTVFQ